VGCVRQARVPNRIAEPLSLGIGLQCIAGSRRKLAIANYSIDMLNRRERLMTWETPVLIEMRVGMEITSYESADMDSPDGDIID
jgi:coenzyme PQQ precursor peptide PqqA